MEQAEHWKQSYFNLRHTMQEWHAQAVAAGFDGVPDVLLVAGESAKLFSALNAMLTQFGMDEDEWNRPTFKKAKAAIEQYLAARAASPQPKEGAVTEEPEPEPWEHPCPFRGEPTMTPAGKACSACGLREEQTHG